MLPKCFEGLINYVFPSVPSQRNIRVKWFVLLFFKDGQSMVITHPLTPLTGDSSERGTDCCKTKLLWTEKSSLGR